MPEKAYYEAIFRIDLGAVDNYLVNFEADGVFSNITKPKLILKNVFSAYADTFEQIFEDGKNEELSFMRNAKLYFCKIFLKHVGVSPRRYAKNKKL